MKLGAWAGESPQTKVGSEWKHHESRAPTNLKRFEIYINVTTSTLIPLTSYSKLFHSSTPFASGAHVLPRFRWQQPGEWHLQVLGCPWGCSPGCRGWVPFPVTKLLTIPTCSGTPRWEHCLKGSSTSLQRQMRPRGRLRDVKRTAQARPITQHSTFNTPTRPFMVSRLWAIPVVTC